MTSDIRKQVLAEIVACMVEAEADGREPFLAAAVRFPGTPGGVLGEAFHEASEVSEEAWWRTIERTIDGEVIRNAIVGAVADPADAGPREAELDAAFDALARGDVSSPSASSGGAPSWT